MIKKMWAKKWNNGSVVDLKENPNPKYGYFPVYILTEDEYKKLKRDPFENVRKIVVNDGITKTPKPEKLKEIWIAVKKAIQNFDKGE